MISVEIMRPDQGADIRTFDKHEILIGRKPDNDIVIEERDVSGRHACLRVADGAVTIIDLGSTNGTYVDGAPIETRVLHADALVQVAGHTLKIHAAPAPEALERALVDPPLLGEPPPPLLGVDDLPPLLVGVQVAPDTTRAAEPALLDPGAASAVGTDRHATVPPKLLDAGASPRLPAAPALPVSAGGAHYATLAAPTPAPEPPPGAGAAPYHGAQAPPAPIRESAVE
ncbi:MAG: FHA domain-containing protein, partial [Myxococcales bacterium]|nr:FHA domain-containing protein [Myxococcales bacterium]